MLNREKAVDKGVVKAYIHSLHARSHLRDALLHRETGPEEGLREVGSASGSSSSISRLSTCPM
jgi:hypothetical protein